MTWCLIRWLCSWMQVSFGPMTNIIFFFSWAVISCITKSFVWFYARIVTKPWTFIQNHYIFWTNVYCFIHTQGIIQSRNEAIDTLERIRSFYFISKSLFGGHASECNFTSTKRHVFHFTQEKPIWSISIPRNIF
jgi:hypothetical protein